MCEEMSVRSFRKVCLVESAIYTNILYIYVHDDTSPLTRLRHRHPIRDPTIRHNRILSKATKFVLRRLQHLRLHLHKRRQFTPPIITITTLGKRFPQWNRALIENKMNVPRDSSIVLVGGGVTPAAVLTIPAQRFGRLDDFHVESRAKGFHVRDNEGAVALEMIGGQDGRELREAEGREDGGDIGVVGEVWCWWIC